MVGAVVAQGELSLVMLWAVIALGLGFLVACGAMVYGMLTDRRRDYRWCSTCGLYSEVSYWDDLQWKDGGLEGRPLCADCAEQHG